MKEYYCPKCKRKIAYDKKYQLVCCVRCSEEMFVVEDNLKGYKIEDKKDGTRKN